MEEERNNNRRCGQIGDGEDDELSMVDVLKEEARLRADADAVLGGSDPNNCTYPKGYLKRQALYACATCTPQGNAGICLACSYACHEGHDLYELYTKRYFACDCGNEKFANNRCKLFTDKKEMNARNRYDQNFRGTYCTCVRPYPDPDDSVEDQMIQCVMCEDWYHGRHLNSTVPDDDDFQEMICPGCMSKYSFLWAYYVKPDLTKVECFNTSEENATVDIEKLDKTEGDEEKSTTELIQSPCCHPVDAPSDSQTESKENCHVEDTSTGKSAGVKRRAEESQDQDSVLKRAKLEEESSSLDECVLKQLEKRAVDHPDDAATFWPEGWRQKLCQCQSCMDMYKDRLIEYLVDECDTVKAYESLGQENSEGAPSDEETEASALAGLDRVQQIEMVRGFMDLKTELNEFLQGFAREGKVVTETDIREFFQRMNQRRRRQIQLPQDSCR